MVGIAYGRALVQIVHGAARLRARQCSHRCHERNCVNPAHLLPKTAEMNNKRILCTKKKNCKHSISCIFKQEGQFLILDLISANCFSRFQLIAFRHRRQKQQSLLRTASEPKKLRRCQRECASRLPSFGCRLSTFLPIKRASCKIAILCRLQRSAIYRTRNRKTLKVRNKRGLFFSLQNYVSSWYRECY